MNDGPGRSSDPPIGPGGLIAERYRVDRQLGKGGMGVVYAAEHVQLRRPCALKILLTRSAGEKALERRFLRGARNAARIEHPNVCQIYDFGYLPDGRPFLAMELVPGGSLGALLADGTSLPVRTSIHIGVGIARALEAAHDLGIVHRDLKPDNVMLRAGGTQPDDVKVVDFDIARALLDADDHTITQPLTTIGTPEYMSPEQCVAEELDGRSDLYALGLIICRMVAGKLPFRGTSTRQRVMERIGSDPVPLAELAPEVPLPEGLERLVSRLLAPSPEDRPQGTREVRLRLEEIGKRMDQAAPRELALSSPSLRTVPWNPAAASIRLVPEDFDSVPERQETRPSPAPTTDQTPWLGALQGIRLRWMVAGMVLFGLALAGSSWWLDAGGTQGEPLPSIVADALDLPEEANQAGELVEEVPIAGAESEVTPSPAALGPSTDSGASSADVELGMDGPREAEFAEVEDPAGALDVLLSDFGAALESASPARLRAVYPDVRPEELEFWLREFNEEGTQVSMEVQTPEEIEGEVGEIRVLLVTVFPPQGPPRPIPVRALLDLSAESHWTFREIRRLN